MDQNSQDQNSTQLREKAGPCPDHIFLILEVTRPPRPHMRRKGSLEAKGEWCQGKLYPDAFLVKSILAKRCVRTHGRILRYTKYGLCTRQIRRIGQRKPEKMPHKIIQTTPRAQLSDSLSVCLCAYPHVLCILFILLMNTLLASLLFCLLEIFFCKAERQGPCHWPLV